MYNKTITEICSQLDTSKEGLTSDVVNKRQQAYGKNKLSEGKKVTKLQRFLAQFKDALIIILMISCILSVVIAITTGENEEFIDAGFIFFVIIVNALIGFIQENKAEADMQALKNMTKPYAKVLRNGKISKIATENIVVGDVVILEAGDIIPADLRLFDTASLKIEESAITGESLPVEKDCADINDENLPLGDRHNMAYTGTVVVYGRGSGIVTAIGDNTEMGKIASVIKERDDERTHLQKRIDKTSKIISIIVLFVSLFIFLLYTFAYHHNILKSFMVAISIAVSAIPEAMPAGITITMALGVKRMSANKAIVRKLSAVETLGNTQVICSDKTGTLTLNKMTVKDYFLADGNNDKSNPSYQTLINCMLLCNDATLKTNESGTVEEFGDPTETALVAFANLEGYNKDTVNAMYPRTNEIPFDSDRKLMTTINTVLDKNIAHTKGAIDSILDRCSKILDNGTTRPITDKDKEQILKANSEFCSRALRVLGYAVKEIDTPDTTEVEIYETEHNMTFVGITGMIDPPREEVKGAIKDCKRAGIVVSMITGDHKDTAFAIAKDLGIVKNPDQVITGSELSLMSDEELQKRIGEWNVFARVSPEHKVRIVKAYKSHDMICAMTGDGVNDAPSLKSADIGIGMGITGTDVTKEVADIILTDDNFATIATAVKEGRTIYQNIMNFIQYLLQTCICEMVILTTIVGILGRELFTPALLLWNNFVSDSFAALAIGVEKPNNNIMDNPPNTNRKNLFSGIIGINIAVGAIIQTTLVFIAYFLSNDVFCYSPSEVTTITFLTFAIAQILHAFNMRNSEESIFKIGWFTNKYMWMASIVSIFFAALFVMAPIPVLQNVLGLTVLTWKEWLLATGLAVSIIPIFEIYKLIKKAIRKNKIK